MLFGISGSPKRWMPAGCWSRSTPPETWERLGRARFRVGDYEASLEAYQRAVDMDPDYWPALNGIGVNELNRWISGERTDVEARTAAADAFRASLRANPDQPKVIRLLTTYGL